MWIWMFPNQFLVVKNMPRKTRNLSACCYPCTHLWTHIFHVRPHSMARLIFIGEKLVLENLESPFILFYFKKENKTRKKTLKKWLHSFGKTSFEKKNPSLDLGIRLPIGKVPLRGSTLLSPKEVSND